MTPLKTLGWQRFPADARSRAWAGAARAEGLRVLADPAMRAQWLQCEGTWFVGVDALANAVDGAIGGVPLGGLAVDALGPLPPLHRAQLSVVFPGYPRPRAGESEAAFRYRRDRAAAHVDGITAEGAERRRQVTEPHGFILGIGLSEADPQAAPLTVWEGSHRVMREALRGPIEAGQADVTEAYVAGRRRVFETCPRIAVALQPGEAVLLHRLTLHGITPWENGASAAPEGRMTAYFRPVVSPDLRQWLGI
ncbi:hypothetical protein [Sagittula sp. S175]|uniref:hypothetical protein n=1 Tax=Sagittula sp. S175 TaxID=3415129 RepID=UPI003C7C5B50